MVPPKYVTFRNSVFLWFILGSLLLSYCWVLVQEEYQLSQPQHNFNQTLVGLTLHPPTTTNNTKTPSPAATHHHQPPPPPTTT